MPAWQTMRKAATRLVNSYVDRYSSDLHRVWAVERPFALHLDDGIARRAGLPPDVAALVESFDADEVRLTLVNVGAERARTVTVQMGAYGEHRATTVTSGGRRTTVNGPHFNVRLAPGAGETLTIGVRRYANRPTLTFPWARLAGP